MKSEDLLHKKWEKNVWIIQKILDNENKNFTIKSVIQLEYDWNAIIISNLNRYLGAF